MISVTIILRILLIGYGCQAATKLRPDDAKNDIENFFLKERSSQNFPYTSENWSEFDKPILEEFETVGKRDLTGICEMIKEYCGESITCHWTGALKNNKIFYKIEFECNSNTLII